MACLCFRVWLSGKRDAMLYSGSETSKAIASLPCCINHVQLCLQMRSNAVLTRLLDWERQHTLVDRKC